VRDRERLEERIVEEGFGAVGCVDGGGEVDRLAFAREARARAGELGPCGRRAPRGREWELDERDHVEPGRAQRGLDALDDVARGEPLGQEVAIGAAGDGRDQRDARGEDGGVAQALGADRVGAEAFGLGFLGHVDEADPELERFVDGTLDVAVIAAARGCSCESYITAADDWQRHSRKLSLSHAQTLSPTGPRDLYPGQMRLVGILIVVLGCSAGDMESLVSVEDPAPTLPPVSISIFEGTAPRAGVRVVFQAADSTVVLETTTGTDGKASAIMEPGGYVTAIDPYPRASSTGDVRTIAGVQPGDHLKLDQDIAEEFVEVTLVVPTDAGAAGYAISTGCEYDIPVPAGTSQLRLYDCGAPADLLLYTVDASSVWQKHIFRANPPLADGATIDLSAETYTAIPDVAVSYANVPATYTRAAVYASQTMAHGWIPLSRAFVGLTGATGTASMKVPAIAGGHAGVVTVFDGATYTEQVVGEWGALATSYTFDPSTMFLPEFTGPASLDIPNHAVTWTTAGGAVQPDHVQVNAQLHRPSPAIAWQWEIVAPGATQVTFPVLPDSIYNVKADDFGSFDVTIGKVPGGYDAVRGNAERVGKWSSAHLVQPGA
jgi:hypothetical protein